MVNLRSIPVEERLRLVEDLWDSISADQEVLSLTSEQKAELDLRLNAYEVDGNKGRLAEDFFASLRRKL